MTEPATTALRDQADAATSDAYGILRILGALQPGGAHLHHSNPGPITRAMLDRLASMLTAENHRRATLCERLSYAAPAPAFWLAHAPGRLRCGPCTDRIIKRTIGTRENETCDHCRAYRPGRVRPVAVHLPAYVPERSPLPHPARPPIIAMFGLCRACFTTDTDVTPC